ncbi:MAG TPA: nucleotidyltransferase domain-containing protein [Solirubrobacteraceae bacterium]|nr:nucleotidyltransferase domain-containing protein [Solirubrobacteraceae bacterium]
MDFRHPLATITPTLDGQVLSVLAGADAEFTGRQVHRLLGTHSERGVRKVLNRLVEQGVVLSRKAGPANLYQLNRDHLATPWIEGLVGLRRELLERLKAEVSTWQIRPAVGTVFGSAARGEASTESDIDLLLIRPAASDDGREAWEAQLASLQAKASAWTGNDARILEFSEEELRGSAGQQDVLKAVAREGLFFAGSRVTIKRLIKRSAR